MTDKNEATQGDAKQPPTHLSFWQIVGSTMAAALGVQKKANKERDFTHGKPIHFITAGVLFTAGFVIGMILIVRFVISMATG